MEKEFIGYNEALALKELGFDESCFSYYKNDQFSDILEEVINSEMRNVNNEIDDYISAPLYQQVFRWFREKYGCHIEIYYNLPRNQWEWCIHKLPEYDQIEDETCSFYDSYEEAELECLKKLISIVKNK